MHLMMKKIMYHQKGLVKNLTPQVLSLTVTEMRMKNSWKLAGIQLVSTLSSLFTIKFLTKSYCCLECEEERKEGEKACCQGKGAEAKSKEKGKIGASKWARNDQQQFFRRQLKRWLE